MEAQETNGIDIDDAVRRVEDFTDLSTFVTRTEYPALRIPVRQTADLRRRLSKQLLHIPKTKNVFDDPENPKNGRLLVLASAEMLQDPSVAALLSENENKEKDAKISATTYTMETTYEFLTADQVLRKLLADKGVQEIPSAFEAVGHIAHVNLRDECLPYKYWIGKVLLDKNKPRIRTVVNKLGNIETEFRTFGMEVIAGSDAKDWSIVTVKEEGCSFQLDFQQVYWNSRLAGEHKRLVNHILKDARRRQQPAIEESLTPMVVADVMAGVGPFAIPLTATATRRNNSNHDDNDANILLQVHANDLNPASFKYLQINAKKNACRNLTCYNEDGRAFVHRLQQQEQEPISHFIMNLPASAPEFLDAFRGYDNHNRPDRPWIHVHCFAPKTAEKEDDYQCAVDRCAKALDCHLDRVRDRVSIHVVRDVSPKKNMLCVTFRLPEAVGTLPKIDCTIVATATIADESIAEPEAKRSRITE